MRAHADPDVTSLASEVTNLVTDSTDLAREVANSAGRQPTGQGR
jgi:hypothetical protein